MIETPDPQEPIGAVDEFEGSPLVGKTPSGEWLKIRKLTDKKDKYSFHMTHQFRMLARFGKKPKGPTRLSMPHVELFGNRGSIIALDIDAEYYTQEVEDHLLALGQYNRITVARSNSGRVKGFLPVLHPWGRINRYDAIKTIACELGEDLASRCDPQGLDRTFINEHLLEAIRYTQVIPSVQVSRVEKHRPLQMVYRFTEDELELVNEKLPEGTPAQRDRWTKLLEIAGSMARRGLEGSLGLSMIWLARELDHQFGVSVCIATVGRDLSVLKHSLKCVDESYTPLHKARTFQFSGWFRKLIERKVGSTSSFKEEILVRMDKPSTGAVYREPPPAPQPGHWYEGLWRATNFFKTEEEYLGWARSLPGIEKKHRFRVAERAWADHIRLGRG